MGPKFKGKSVYKRQAEGDGDQKGAQTQTETNDGATAQDTWSHRWKRQEDLPWRENVTPGFWPPDCDRVDFCGFQPPGLWCFVTAAPGYIFTNSGYYKTLSFVGMRGKRLFPQQLGPGN